MTISSCLPHGRRFAWTATRLLLLLLTLTPAALASEWPHYRGPAYDGVSADPIQNSFPPEGPPQIWKVPLEAGFSSFTVSCGRALTQVRRVVGGQDREVCIALSAANGIELWATPVDSASYTNGGVLSDDGPRSTPCVEEGSVYVLSSFLGLFKLNATNGSVIWQKDLLALYGGDMIEWQNAASPLLDGGLIFLNCNNTNSADRSFLALRQTDGGLVWRRGAARLTHATPAIATIQGVRQIIYFTQAGLVAVASATGDELWRYPFPFSSSTAASPVVDGDIVYCSAAYGIGAGAVRITKSSSQFTATELWRNNKLMNEFSTPVSTQGYVYGLFGRSYQGTAPLKCIELATGTEMWSQPGFGPGGVLLVDGKLLVNDERGGIVLVETYSRAYNELARFQAVEGRSWNSGAICHGRLYFRSATEGACYDLGLPAPPAPLRLIGGLMPPGAHFQMLLGTVDGSPADPARLSQIEVLGSPQVDWPAALWSKVAFVLLGETNGVLCLQDPDSGLFPQRFYVLRDKP